MPGIGNPFTVRFTGPLGPHREGLARELQARGYPRTTSHLLMCVMAHLSRWLEARRLAPEDMRQSDLESYVQHRRAAGVSHRLSLRGVEPVLSYLRKSGVVPVPETLPKGPFGEVLDEYRDYLTKERGLCPKNVVVYGREAGQFLAHRFRSRRVTLANLSAGDVSAFALARCRSVAVRTAQSRVTGLRSFLRYLFLAGLTHVDLRAAAPNVAGSRFSGLPRGLADEDLKALIDGCNRATPAGRRDFAILLLLARLGLRAVEVSRITLEDVDWANGEIAIHGKNGREDCLPIPHDVGEAMVAYLQDGRPQRPSRMLFLQDRAPYRTLTSGTVVQIVQAAGIRAGLGPVGAHRLRHTAATRMLRRGVPLTEIAQVLRHRSIQTTAIYAKVDRDTLRTLARAWPGVAS